MPEVLEEITDEEVEAKVEQVTEEIVEAVAEAEATGQPLPENIQKLVDFMDETGGAVSYTHLTLPTKRIV